MAEDFVERVEPGGRFGRLRGNAIGVVGAVVISMAFMGPATAVFFNTAPMTAGAGYALAASMLLALITCVIIASSIAAFARKIPAAGFAYTYNTHGLGKRGGFMSGTALFGFRTQMQMTRSYIAPVSGLATGDVKLHYLFDTANSVLDEHFDLIDPALVREDIDRLVGVGVG